VQFNIAGSVIHKSITSGEIDIYPEYTGTGLLSILGEDLMTDPDKVYKEVKTQYNKKYEITWLDYSKANDGQGLVIKTSATAKKYGIKHHIRSPEKRRPSCAFASQGEFDKRSDGITGPGPRPTAPFNWKSSKIYDNGLKYRGPEGEQG
jgi:osmoprotectant transport system substrate-binding protein